jgi:hypothetical protein
MIEYIFKFYRIFCDNKWIGYLTIGLTLSAFSMPIFALLFSKSFNSNTNEIFFKLFLFLLSLSKISNYLIINYKLSELIVLNNKLKTYQKKCRISEHFLIIFSFFCILFSILLAFIATKIFFCESFVTKVFRDFNDELDSISMPNFIKVLYVSNVSCKEPNVLWKILNKKKMIINKWKLLIVIKLYFWFRSDYILKGEWFVCSMHSLWSATILY